MVCSHAKKTAKDSEDVGFPEELGCMSRRRNGDPLAIISNHHLAFASPTMSVASLKGHLLVREKMDIEALLAQIK